MFNNANTVGDMDTRDSVREVDHLVIGAGFAGLCMAIKLQEAGNADFLVIERASDVGGTWRDNTYPGAACDVPSQLYSFSFALNPTWSRSFSPQPEIQAYLRRVARESGVLDRFLFDTTLEEARWDETDQRWHAATSAGEIVSRTLVSGAGALVEPKLPDIPGIGGFQGEVFHSARWDHDVDLTGKRVAVIGTGASAIQIVPEIAKVVGHLDLYQRTAPYVLPRNDREYTWLERLAFRHVPGVQRAYREAIYWAREGYVPGFTWQPKLAWPAKQLALRNLAGAVEDPELRARLTPDFQIGCKRILISNTYYPALTQDHVDLVTDPIARVSDHGVVTADGTEREVDVLVIATGFHTTDQPIAHHVHGRDGRSLAETWAEGGMAAYKGTTVRGFPNYFQIVGPNTGLGHSSMVLMIEAQVGYVRDALQTMAVNDYATVEPRQAEQDAWNDDLHRRMGRTVWSSGGCASWYLDEHGRNTVLWPRTTWTFRQLLARFDPAAYELTSDRYPHSHTRSLDPEGGRMKTLDDKVVVITGAGSGIGRALALNCAARGSLLALSDVDEAGLAQTVDLAKNAGARQVHSARLDVSDRAAFTAYAAEVAEHFGRVNVVVNNAGVALTGDIEDVGYDDMDWIVGINFWGVVHGTKEFLPHLIASGDGHVVNISSLFGLISIPGQSLYNATKYAVRGYSEALREEMLMHDRPVGVTVVHPGGIKTAIARSSRAAEGVDQQATAALFDEKLAKMTPERAAEIIVGAVLKNRARCLVGLDAHALHHFAKLTGSRYQDVVVKATKRMLPARPL